MPLLANPRHEAFAQARANGLKVYDAYIAAGFEGNPTAASQVENRPEVRSRIQELHQEKLEKRRQIESERPESESISDLDRNWILRELKKNVVKGQETGQVSAANKAIELMMEVLDIGPKKGKATDEEAEASKKTNVPDADKLGSVLDKIEQMGSTNGLFD